MSYRPTYDEVREIDNLYARGEITFDRRIEMLRELVERVASMEDVETLAEHRSDGTRQREWNSVSVPTLFHEWLQPGDRICVVRAKP